SHRKILAADLGLRGNVCRPARGCAHRPFAEAEAGREVRGRCRRLAGGAGRRARDGGSAGRHPAREPPAVAQISMITSLLACSALASATICSRLFALMVYVIEMKCCWLLSRSETWLSSRSGTCSRTMASMLARSVSLRLPTTLMG